MSSADISNLSLSLPRHRVGLFLNDGCWTHSFNSVKTLYLENFKSMPVPFVWIALQGKASSCLVRGSHIHTAEHWSHLPLGANAVPLCHETHFGFVVFKSPVYIIRRDLCCQLPEWHFYSMKSCLCALHGTRCLKAWGLLGWFEIK